MEPKKQKHQPVLLNTVLELLAPQAGQTYLDLTAGYGGHAAAIAKQIGTSGRLILIDRDPQAIANLNDSFKGARIIHQDFDTATRELVAEGTQADMILMDLGVSSPQLDMPARGFSLRSSGPLDMRMDNSQGRTAEEIVNHYSESELADVLYQFGGERRSRRIAKAIVAARPLHNTEQLASVIAKTQPHYSRIHPATRSFQALRLVVNDELGQLERSLPRSLDLLRPGGRLVVISFHSLEDRLVKQFLKTHKDELTPLTKKVIPGKLKDVSNPRARSAKLRAAIKN